MRIGQKDNSLYIERIAKNPSLIWRFEATIVGAGWMFAGMHDRVVVHTSTETAKEMASFAARTSHRLDVELSEGGWLRLKRDARGYLLIRYRVGRLGAGAAL